MDDTWWQSEESREAEDDFRKTCITTATIEWKRMKIVLIGAMVAVVEVRGGKERKKEGRNKVKMVGGA